MGLILFNVFIKDGDDRTEYLLTGFANHTKMRGEVLYTSRKSHHAESPRQTRRPGQQELHKYNVLHMRNNDLKLQCKMGGILLIWVLL